MTVRFLKSDPAAQLPSYAHPGDAGMDLRSIEDAVIEPGTRRLVRTGLKMQLPDGFEAQVRPRSGLALRHGVTVLNSPGTVDSGYRGELAVLLVNLGAEPFAVEKGMRIAQMVVAPVVRVDVEEAEALDGSARSEGGFGSSGVM